MGIFFQFLAKAAVEALWLATSALAWAYAVLVICAGLCRLWMKKALSFSAALVKPIAEEENPPDPRRRRPLHLDERNSVIARSSSPVRGTRVRM